MAFRDIVYGILAGGGVVVVVEPLLESGRTRQCHLSSDAHGLNCVKEFL
jgi:hypothetical protein